MEIHDSHVNVTALDLDGDGMLDAIDPLPTLNNYAGLSIFSVWGVIPVYMIERRTHRKK